MKESSFYQAIVEEGRVDQARDDILRLGELKFRSLPPDPIQTTLKGLADLPQLKGILERILDVDTWQDLLIPHSPSSLPHQGEEAPKPAPSRRRKKP
jgi:hypothetical protein